MHLKRPPRRTVPREDRSVNCFALHGPDKTSFWCSSTTQLPDTRPRASHQESGVFLFHGALNLLQRVDRTEYIQPALKVGETVMLNIYDTGAEGVIVERLNESYVRVNWADSPTPTLHSEQTLRRVGNSDL